MLSPYAQHYAPANIQCQEKNVSNKGLFLAHTKTARITLFPMRPPKKTCVEDCLNINIHKMPKGRNILRWMQDNKEIASLEYERTQDAITFRAQVIALSPKPRSIQNHHIKLATAPSFREIGLQQWFVCECGSKFRNLYMPASKADFRCRFCHNLTHRSAQTHNGYLARRKSQPDVIREALASRKPDRVAFGIKAAIAAPIQGNHTR